MANLIMLKSISDQRGSLTVLDNIEDVLPFSIKRIFYIQHAKGTVRGGHRHVNTTHAVICVVGSCVVAISNPDYEEEYLLNGPDKCLIIDTDDWHTMYNFSSNAILLALASTAYNPDDYIYEPYSKVMADVEV